MRKKAFTLIELIVVLAIMTGISALTLVRSGIYGKIMEKKEAETLLADINYCRQKSLASGNVYKIEAERDMYEIKNGTSNFDFEKKVKLKYLSASYKYVLKFTSTGVVINAKKIIFLSSENRYEYIISPIAGRIRINEEKI